MKLTLERIEDLRQSFHPTHAEALALLDSARALARMEAFLRSGPNRDAQAYTLSADEFAVTVDSPAVVRAGIRSDLASAIHAALDEAEARK